jgi:hypothetical protein
MGEAKIGEGEAEDVSAGSLVGFSAVLAAAVAIVGLLL